MKDHFKKAPEGQRLCRSRQSIAQRQAVCRTAQPWGRHTKKFEALKGRRIEVLWFFIQSQYSEQSLFPPPWQGFMVIPFQSQGCAVMQTACPGLCSYDPFRVFAPPGHIVHTHLPKYFKHFYFIPTFYQKNCINSTGRGENSEWAVRSQIFAFHFAFSVRRDPRKKRLKLQMIIVL